MLTAYETRTRQLLQNPSAPTSLYATTDIDSWVNQARGQVAGETECCRALGTLNTTIGTRNYNFSAITLPSSVGLQGVLSVRAMRYSVGSGFQWMRPRPWPWFDLYMNNPVPPSGPPNKWSQYGQGSAGTGSITGIGSGSMSSGSFYIDPIPDSAYALTMDCACYPSALAADTDFEAIPYLFTDAVPYFAAYLALMSAQTGARIEQASKMMELYQMFIARANQASAPNVNRYLYSRQFDPTQLNKLGQQKSVGGQQ